MNSSTLYDAFNDLISMHKITILDSPDLCKVEFKKYGLDENELEVKLFFLLLEKNIPLEVRKLVAVSSNYTAYGISVLVYTSVFASEKLSNEYESILLNHINLIVEVLLKEKVIFLDYKNEVKNYSCDFETGLINLFHLYGINVLENTSKLKSLLKDLKITSSEDKIEDFVVFVEKLNNNKATYKTKKNEKFLKLLNTAVEKNKLEYPPLTKEYKKYINATRRKENEKLEKEKHENHDENINKEDLGNFLKRKASSKIRTYNYIDEKKIIYVILVLVIVIGLIVLAFVPGTSTENSVKSVNKTNVVTKTMYVASDALNIRSKSSSESEIVGVLSKGDKVDVMYSNENDWVFIKSGKKEGYVNVHYLSNEYIQPKKVSVSEKNTITKSKLDLSSKNMKTKD